MGIITEITHWRRCFPLPAIDVNQSIFFGLQGVPNVALLTADGNDNDGEDDNACVGDEDSADRSNKRNTSEDLLCLCPMQGFQTAPVGIDSTIISLALSSEETEPE